MRINHKPSGNTVYSAGKKKLTKDDADTYAERVLIVDNESSTRKLLRTHLRKHGFDVVDVGSGKEALDKMSNQPDLIILGTEIPDVNSYDILRAVRETGSNAAVIMLSRYYDERSIVEALDLGADDYVCKPFIGMREFIARVHAALRHRLQVQPEKPLFQVGGLSVDVVHRIVKVHGKKVKLTRLEYELLNLLVQRSGKVVRWAFIMKRLW
jgi:two-component system KDP operon response regulator KdpE